VGEPPRDPDVGGGSALRVGALGEGAAGAYQEGLVREAMAVVGKYADPAGPSRVSRDHDEHLTDAYEG
jgi:hypothetical protein